MSRRIHVAAPSIESELWGALYRLGLEPQHGPEQAVLSILGPEGQAPELPGPRLSLNTLPDGDSLQRELWRLRPALQHIQLGAARLDLATRTLTLPTGTQTLSPTELRLLLWFRGRPNQILTGGELLKEVWGYRAGVQTRTLVSTMHRLRAKLEVDPANPQVLLTEVGLGYRLRLPEPKGPSLPGRAVELQELIQKLSPGVRCIVGPGGVGKTTLARAAYRALSPRFPRRAWVELLGLRTRTQILAALANALQVPAQLTVLREHLADGPALLVLDNAEGLEETLPQVLEALSLTQSCVLVTSRVPLPQSEVMVLHGLPLPQATELLLSRARPLRSDYGADAAAVTELVERLDGLPLALELAAAQARLLSPSQMLARLRQKRDLKDTRPGRHSSLMGVVRENLASLSPAQLRALRSLATFDGPMPALAVEAMAGEDLLAELHELLARALVQEEQGQLRVLETVRHVLPAPDPTQTLAHAHYLLREDGPLREWSTALGRCEGAEHATLLARVGQRLVDQGQLGLLEQELRRVAPHSLSQAQKGHLDLLRARVLQEAGQAESARRALLALRGGAVDTEARLQAAELCLELQDPEPISELVDGLPEDLVVRLRSGLCAAGAHFMSGRLAAAEAGYAEALELARRSEDPLWVCKALYAMSVIPFVRGRFTEMVAALQEARTAARGNPHWQALTGHRLGLAYHRLSNVDAALQAMHQAEQICRRAGLYRVAASMLSDRAGVLAEQGMAAEGTVRQALHLARRFELPLYQQTSLVSLTSLLLNRQALDEGARCLEELEISLRDHPNPLLSAVCTGHHGVLSHRRGHHDLALPHLERATLEMEALGQGVRSCIYLGRMAWIYAQLGQEAEARAHLQRAQDVLGDQDNLAQLVDAFALRTREALGEDVSELRAKLTPLAGKNPRLAALLTHPG